MLIRISRKISFANTIMERFFTAESLVIITSKDEVDALQWKKYMEKNWDRLMQKNSKLLVLAGIHGEQDGKLGHLDVDLLQDYRRQIDYFMGKNAKKKPPHQISQDIKEKNIQFALEDVSKSFKGTEMDEQKLIEAVEKHNPTIISLSFCYTNVSELNDVFRSAGIYTVLIMTQDQANITEGKYVILDPVQKALIQNVVEHRPKHLFLWGSSGTGKTLLLTQALGIKVSSYRKEGIKKLNIFITSYMSGSNNGESMLMDDLKQKYLTHLAVNKEDIRFIYFEELCQGLCHNDTTLFKNALNLITLRAWCED